MPRISLATLACATIATASPVAASAQNFDIPSGSAETTLEALAQQASLQLIMPSRIVSNQQTAPVRGRMSVSQALEKMLHPTKLTAIVKDRTIIVLMHASTPSVQYAAMSHTAGSEYLPAEGVAPGVLPFRSASVLADDIIVTARRREERAQDIPVAVTAVSGLALERQAIVSITDMPRLAPALNIAQGAGMGRMTPFISLRGQRQGDNLPSLDPSVGVYMGDVVIQRLFGFDQMLFDLGSVEVVKGPQGTLFGRNSTGGNIIIRPNTPDDLTAGMIKLSLGNYNWRQLDGFVNMALSDRVAIRLAGRYNKRDGYIRDITHGQDLNDEDGYALRGTVRLDLTDNINSLTTIDYLDRDTMGTGMVLTAFRPGSVITNLYGVSATDALAQARALGFYQTATNAASFATAWNFGISNTTSITLGDITLKNIIGYRKFETHGYDDVDGSVLPILEYGQDTRGDQFSEEFQIQGVHHGLDWIAGMYFFKEKVIYRANNLISLSPFQDGQTAPYQINTIDRNRSVSIFAQASKDLDDMLTGLSLTAGGRYTWDRRHARYGQRLAIGYTLGETNAVGTPSPGERCAFPDTMTSLAENCQINRIAKFSKFTYSLSLNYKVAPDKLLYIAHRKGYRSGGWSTRATSAAQAVNPFLPENVKDYEFGAKMDWNLGGPILRTNLAVYHQNYNNIQRLVPFVTPFGNVATNVVNAAKATIDGGELEVVLRTTEGLELTGAVAVVDPKYKNFTVASATGPIDVSKTANYGGVSKTTYNLGARYVFALGRGLGDLALQANWSHQSSFYTQDRTTQEVEGLVEARGLLNARIDWTDVGGRPVDLSVFTTNLLNKKYTTGRYTLMPEFGFATRTAGPPRMVGVEARFRFGE